MSRQVRICLLKRIDKPECSLYRAFFHVVPYRFVDILPGYLSRDDRFGFHPR